MLDQLINSYKNNHQKDEFCLLMLDFDLDESNIDFRILAQKFKQIFSKSDLFCRASATRILFLFPNAVNLEILIMKINAIIEGSLGIGNEKIIINNYLPEQLAAMDIEQDLFQS